MGRPRKTPDNFMLVAKESFVVRREGADRNFVAGVTTIAPDHPWLEGIRHLFEPARPHYDVEQATAAPGELRGDQ